MNRIREGNNQVADCRRRDSRDALAVGLRQGNEGSRFLDRWRYSSFGVPCCRLNFIEVHEQSVISFLSSPPTSLSFCYPASRAGKATAAVLPLVRCTCRCTGDGRKQGAEQSKKLLRSKCVSSFIMCTRVMFKREREGEISRLCFLRQVVVRSSCLTCGPSCPDAGAGSSRSPPSRYSLPAIPFTHRLPQERS